MVGEFDHSGTAAFSNDHSHPEWDRFASANLVPSIPCEGFAAVRGEQSLREPSSPTATKSPAAFYDITMRSNASSTVSMTTPPSVARSGEYDSVVG